jgi:hypothetical protein
MAGYTMLSRRRTTGSRARGGYWKRASSGKTSFSPSGCATRATSFGTDAERPRLALPSGLHKDESVGAVVLTGVLPAATSRTSTSPTFSRSNAEAPCTPASRPCHQWAFVECSTRGPVGSARRTSAPSCRSPGLRWCTTAPRSGPAAPSSRRRGGIKLSCPRRMAVSSRSSSARRSPGNSRGTYRLSPPR